MPGIITQDAIHSAAELLRVGDTVAFPTETVYGLGADAANPLAVRRIFEIKGRPDYHPVSTQRWSALSAAAAANQTAVVATFGIDETGTVK